MLYPQIRRLPKCSPSTIHRTVSIAPLISKEWNVLLYSLEVQYPGFVNFWYLNHLIKIMVIIVLH